MTTKNYLGHLLVANPNNPMDEFSKSIVLVISHSDKSAVGLQINRVMDNITLQSVALGLGIELPNPDPLYYGGNMSPNKIHVVHSLDWRSSGTADITEDVGVTNDISILSAISQGEGPKKYRAVAGHHMWEAKVLDDMLNPRKRSQQYKWETIPANDARVFLAEGSEQWRELLDDTARYQVSTWF